MSSRDKSPLILLAHSYCPQIKSKTSELPVSNLHVLSTTCCCEYQLRLNSPSASTSFSSPSPMSHCHKKLQEWAALLTRVDGRTTDNLGNDLLNFRSQTSSLQVDRVASSHCLEQVGTDLIKRQRPALTDSPLG